MDGEDFRRKLGGGMDPSETCNEVEDGEPLNLNHRENTVEGANTELIEPDPAVFAAATAVEVENQRALGLSQWNFYQEEENTEPTEPDSSAAVVAAALALSPLSFGLADCDSLADWDFLLKSIADEQKTIEEINHDMPSPNDVTAYLSDPNTGDDGNQGDNDFEEAMATHERGSNNLADSRDSGTHRPNFKAGHAEAVASSQLVSAHSYNQEKDELDYSRNQGHSLINHKPSQGASCATLPDGIGDDDETQLTSFANTDGEKLEFDPGEPRVGLEFCSEDAAYEFYNKYAKRTGFTLRKGKTERSKPNNTIKAKYFLCSREGYKSTEQINKPTRYKRRDTRTGCEAKIKCMVSDGRWTISKVVLEHTHDLKGSLPVAHGRADDARATTALLVDEIVNEGTTFGEQARVSEVNCSDVLRGTWKNHPMLEAEDIQGLIDHLTNGQIEDPSFFYTLQVTTAYGMANFFWTDSRSKIDYEHFGDVLVLDTRTRINKYDMICAAFWGLNHHRQRIIFGCAFLVDQTVDSFHWLLRSFLKAMRWQKPQTIITEVGEEITNALRVVLPETSHCLPFWSIWNGFNKNVSALSDRPSVGNLFRDCVIHVHSPEEFELKWNSFIKKYKLHDNTWLASLYGMRKKWSHAFTKNVFSAGLISIQNNEDACDIFGSLSCETMTLSQIADWCGKMAERMRREESQEDMLCEKITANLQCSIPVEKEVERLCTGPIFRMLQKELISSLSLAIEEIGGKATLREFKLTEQGSMKIDTVKFDPSNSTLVCSCGKFESVGILCFHALKVLNFMNIFEIPSHYILKRWTNSAKDSVPVDTPRARTAPDGGSVFRVEFMRQASHVAHMSVNNKRKIKAMRIVKSAVEHIAQVPKTEEVAVVPDNSDGNGMDQTICEYLETQLNQENVAKSGIRRPRVKRKVSRPLTIWKT